MKKLILIALALTGCGSFDVNVPNSTQNVVQSGSSYAYIVVRLEFINEIKQLCQDLNNNVPDSNERARLVADCTFERMSLLNFDFGALTDVQNDLCTIDPATLTPDQLQVYLAICN